MNNNCASWIKNMRVIIFGSKILSRELAVCLSSENTYTLCGTNHYKLRSLVRRREFDIALVDAAVQNVKVTCDVIRGLQDIPVVLFVRQKQADWRKFLALDPDGYISDAETEPVKKAHLRAIMRRYYQANENKQKGGRE